MSNKFYLTLALIIIYALAHAQTITVKKQNEKVKGENVEGFAAELDGKISDVGSLWSKFLKEVGRVKLFSSEPVIITEPNFNGTVYAKGIVYAHIFESGNQTRVWLGILPTEWNENEANFANKEIEKLVYQFGIRYHRAKVQKQIDETQEADDTVEKQKLRLIGQNKELLFQLTNNERERAQLQNSIVNNTLENEALKIKMERNKRAQDSLASVSVQIKAVKEVHQERLRKIN